MKSELGRGKLPFAKNRTINELKTDINKDRAFKYVYVLLYMDFYTIDRAEINDTLQAYDLHHLKSKGAYPELRYKFSNCVLLTRTQHSNLHNGTLPKDYDDREPVFINFLKKMEF